MEGSHMGLLLFFCSSMLFAAFAAASSRNLPIIPVDEGYAPWCGDSNLVIHRDGKSVHLSLDERTGFFFFVFCFFASFCFWLDNLCGVVEMVISVAKVFTFFFRISGVCLQVQDLCRMIFTFTDISALLLSCLLTTLQELWLPSMWVFASIWWLYESYTFFLLWISFMSYFKKKSHSFMVCVFKPQLVYFNQPVIFLWFDSKPHSSQFSLSFFILANGE